MKMREMNADRKNRATSADEIDIQACSPTECTGLIPTPPNSKGERENYDEIFHYLPKAAAPYKTDEDA